MKMSLKLKRQDFNNNCAKYGFVRNQKYFDMNNVVKERK